MKIRIFAEEVGVGEVRFHAVPLNADGEEVEIQCDGEPSHWYETADFSCQDWHETCGGLVVDTGKRLCAWHECVAARRALNKMR